jgi:hypothetical protein
MVAEQSSVMQEENTSSTAPREIEDILRFRSDISPFLIHLTRGTEMQTAAEALEQIIAKRQLVPGDEPVSDAQFGVPLQEARSSKREFFRAICFTDTPLNEVHCLLEIATRRKQLEPYGIAFLKEKLRANGVSPVFYINNEGGDKDPVISALCKLIDGSSVEAAKEVLPLVSVFGKKLTGVGAAQSSSGVVDWLWEREWRYPAVKGPLEFKEGDIFVGFCPQDEISNFEDLMPGVGFIDPRRNIRWYATKLIRARQRLDLKYSVV